MKTKNKKDSSKSKTRIKWPTRRTKRCSAVTMILYNILLNVCVASRGTTVFYLIQFVKTLPVKVIHYMYSFAFNKRNQRSHVTYTPTERGVTERQQKIIAMWLFFFCCSTKKPKQWCCHVICIAFALTLSRFNLSI